MAAYQDRTSAFPGSASKPLRFHWRLPYAGETSGLAMADQSSASAIGLPDPDAQASFCRSAEECGIDSLLVDFGFAKPDPMVLAAVLGRATERIKFLLAYRSGLFSPTMFVQQINTLSALIQGRVLLNVVAGYSPEEQRAYGDFLSHDERYERTEEFLAVCRAFWEGDEVNYMGKHYRIEKGSLKTPFVAQERKFPEIIIGGGSAAAQELAIRQGTCWMQLADAPEKIQQACSAVLARGVEVGVRVCLIARPTREDAVQAAQALVIENNYARKLAGGREFFSKTDSVSFKKAYQLGVTEWLTPTLWTGAVRVQGPTAIALVGSPEEIAAAIVEYKKIGVSQFIFSGWPKLDEMLYFGRVVLPLIRQKEHELPLETGIERAAG
ncbi:MAG TPA: LLM class flavin-dependent oxidoreductase [Candidatus Sulfotelmatobacter sp.]|nr:LLM class flavin-dependent oxidoreductase [Candidatus Sulfotelmatobacter sp.]